jgi:acyl-coenzyme A synthetase/AMP-(fatty) acid ligase
VIFVNEFPKSDNGKALRREMRVMAEKIHNNREGIEP